MKKLYKRIISGVFAFVILFFSCIPPVYASPSVDVNVNVDVGIVDLFDWLVDGFTMGGNWLRHFFDDDVCPGNPNYESRHNFVQRHTQVDGKTGLYYVCEYCGKSAGEVGQEAYSDYVGTLPFTGWNSEGHFIWQPAISDIETAYMRGKICNATVNSVLNELGTANGYKEYYALSNHNGFNVKFYGVTSLTYELWFILPLDGFYRQLSSCKYSGSFVSGSGSNLSVYDDYDMESGFTHYSATITIKSTSGTFKPQSVDGSSFGSFNWYFPIFEVIPDSAISDGQYSVTTRPTSITGGNYGIVGDNGQITTVVDNSSIINETNNTYYNPSTGQYYTFNNWTYDYSDRSYNLTLETGDTVTVTYGDQYITIIEGDTIYNIYYIIEGSGSGSDDGGCTHEWQLTDQKEGNCLTPAQRTYTCSLCGKQYTETDPVLGHSWRIIQTVSTKYDEEGNLVQEGYTLYECERCGEQYKSTNDTGPPAVSPGDDVDDGGLLDWINSLIKYLSDHLSSAVDLILSFFRKIPELFGGFLEFLSAMFPFLPDDIIFLLTFGIAAVVFVGIIKAIRR